MDTTLVITLTFAGKYPALTLVNMIVTGYLLKVAYEVLATPLTYLVVGWLKASEHADAFDRNEDFNPFHLGRKRGTRVGLIRWTYLLRMGAEPVAIFRILFASAANTYHQTTYPGSCCV